MTEPQHKDKVNAKP